MSAKSCTKCGDLKSVSDFGAGRNQCKECRKAYLRAYYAQNEAYFVNYRQVNASHINSKSVACWRRTRHERYAAIQSLKSKPCLDCGGSYPWYVLDFDHRQPSQKVADISTMVKSYVPWVKVLEEIAKCDLVCVCCHRNRTYAGDDNYRSRRYKEGQAFLQAVKSEACTDCGNHFAPCQMDFDHVRGEKVSGLSRLLSNGASVKQLQDEISKCDLVCANCHRIRTFERPAPKASRRLVLNSEQTTRTRGRYTRI